MKILLDGDYFTSGDIDIIRDEMLADDPAFDVERLQYDKASQIADAKERASVFASGTRRQIVDEQDSMRRDSWTVKGVLAALTLAIDDPATFKSTIAPAVEHAFQTEATMRGLDETAHELMQASVQKMLSLLVATGLVEGTLRGIEHQLDTGAIDNVDEFLAQKRDEAGVLLSEFLSTAPE